jgi:uncharacterized protein YbjT (DUF2867 family)
MASETILVCGATGTIGGATVEALLSRGANLRALVRDPKKAKGLEKKVELVTGDLANVDSLRAALRGIRRALLIVPGNPYQPDQVALGGNFVAAMKESKLDHLVYLSMWGAGRSVNKPPVMQNHAAIEDAIVASGFNHTFLQTTFTMQALLAQGLGQTAGAQGNIFTPFGDAGFAFVDARDVGKAAAACLTSDAHKGKTYELSGPQPLTANELAATIGKVIGRAVASVPLTVEQAMGALKQMGLPAWFTDQMALLAAYNRTGALARTTPAIAELTGSAPGTFEQFVRDHRAAFGA